MSEHLTSVGINWWGLGSQYENNPAFAWYAITFVIFLAVLFYAIKKPLSEYLKARSQLVRRQIEEANTAKREADQRVQQYEERLAKLDEEIAQITTQFKRHGEAEKANLRVQAEKVSSQIRKNAEESIDAELKHAALELKKEVALLSIALTRKSLPKQMTETVNEQICSAFSSQLEMN